MQVIDQVDSNQTPSSVEFKLTTRGEDMSTTPKSYAPSSTQKTDQKPEATQAQIYASVHAYLQKADISEFDTKHNDLSALDVKRQPAQWAIKPPKFADSTTQLRLIRQTGHSDVKLESAGDCYDFVNYIDEEINNEGLEFRMPNRKRVADTEF